MCCHRSAVRRTGTPFCEYAISTELEPYVPEVPQCPVVRYALSHLSRVRFTHHFHFAHQYPVRYAICGAWNAPYACCLAVQPFHQHLLYTSENQWQEQQNHHLRCHAQAHPYRFCYPTIQQTLRSKIRTCIASFKTASTRCKERGSGYHSSSCQVCLIQREFRFLRFSKFALHSLAGALPHRLSRVKVGVRPCIEIQSPRSPLKHNQSNTIER